MKFIALLICFCFCTNTTIAQTHSPIIKKYKHVYSWNGTTYKFSEMDHVFDKDKEMKNQYLFARKTFSNAKTLGWTSITTILTAGFFAKIDSQPLDGVLFSGGQAVGAVLLVLIAPATGLAALIALLKYDTRKNRLIRKFNERIHEKGGSLSQSSLRVGPTSNGFGLTITF